MTVIQFRNIVLCMNTKTTTLVFFTTLLILSCSIGKPRVVIQEVTVPGGKTVIGNDIDCSIYNAHIPDLYVAVYETNWDTFEKVINYGITKKYVTIKNGAIFPLIGLFPQYSNLIVDTTICPEVTSVDDQKIVCVETEHNKPVRNISWYGAALFCNILSEMNGYKPCYDTSSWDIIPKTNGYRLPTFEEWEYLAREGSLKSDYLYSGSNDPFTVGWFAQNSQERTHNTGELTPNKLGLYDMSGNVNEFCTETYKPVITSSKTQGSALLTSNRIWRGGSYSSDVMHVYGFRQNINNPEYYMPFDDVGFRMVRQ